MNTEQKIIKNKLGVNRQRHCETLQNVAESANASQRAHAHGTTRPSRASRPRCGLTLGSLLAFIIAGGSTEVNRRAPKPRRAPFSPLCSVRLEGQLLGSNSLVCSPPSQNHSQGRRSLVCSVPFQRQSLTPDSLVCSVLRESRWMMQNALIGSIRR